MEYDFELFGFNFRYFFDADVDEYCHQDLEGYEVYVDDILVAEIFNITKDKLFGMEEDEIIELIEDNRVTLA